MKKTNRKNTWNHGYIEDVFNGGKSDQVAGKNDMGGTSSLSALWRHGQYQRIQVKEVCLLAQRLSEHIDGENRNGDAFLKNQYAKMGSIAVLYTDC